MLITNQDNLKEFLNTVLEPLETDHVYICITFARKKYADITRSIELLDRYLIKDIDRAFDIIWSHSFIENRFRDKGQIIPESAVGMYIDVNPKSTIKAYSILMKEYSDYFYQSFKDKEYLKLFRKLDTKVLSCIQSSTAEKKFRIIDIDKKERSLLDKIVNVLNKDDIVWVSETRGGYHIITKPQALKTFYLNKLNELENIEILKESVTPLVGTLQGGFKVRKVYI